MVIRKTATLRTSETVANRYQDDINTQLNTVSSTLIIDGALATIEIEGASAFDIPLFPGLPNFISTGLGRPIIGFFIADKNAESTIWREPVDEDQENTTIDLRTDAAVVVRVWVF